MGPRASNRKTPFNSRAAFNVGITYNDILDDPDDGYLDACDEASDLFHGSSSLKSISMTFDNSLPSSHAAEGFDKLASPIKKKKRKILKRASASDKCIGTDVLPDSFRSRFSFKKFNRMQTEAFPVLYGGDANCVISSPTGSGKTVLFELAILRLIKKSDYKIGNIKILYIAPIKSLCCERLKDWSISFLNLSVGMLTSDTSFLETEKVKKCNIIITTPEKWDLLTRKWKDYCRLFELVRLVLVDEIHTLRERRGATLEVVLTRMNTLCDNIRIIAVSATVPNIEDVSHWLKSKGNGECAKVLFFDDSYRQVALQKHVYSYSFPNKTEFQHDSLYNLKLNEILEKHSKGRPVLIFCPTRASAISTAKYIKQNCAKYLSRQPNLETCKLNDGTLFEYFNDGVAFHHAGLSTEDRNAVEKGFLEGGIKILCSTSTLAMGVNLPAYLVIIKGTRMWVSSTTQEYSQLDILQMIGRAGRPKFETEGCAVIMTESKMSDTYEKLLEGTESLESSLHLELIEHLAAEICLGTVHDRASALSWLHNTFFYIRFKKDPSKYQGAIKLFEKGPGPDLQLSNFSDSLLNTLIKHDLVRKDGDIFISTAYGHAMTLHYVLFETMKRFLAAEQCLGVAGILSLLSGASEFTALRIRKKERKLYKEINYSPLLKFPFLTEKKQGQKIDHAHQKVSLLIQYDLGGLEYPTSKLTCGLHQAMVQDKILVFKHCFRLLKCIVDTFVEKQDGISLKSTLFLFRSIYGCCWEGSGMELRQLKSIGLVSVRKLVSHGVQSLDDIKRLTNQQIEYYLGLKVGNGAKIKRDINLLPNLCLRCKLEACSTKDSVIECVFKLELSAQFKSHVWHGHNLSIDVEILKTPGEILDFRRISLAHLKSPRTFWVSTTITSDLDEIEFAINCLEVAGLGKTFNFTARDLPAKYHEVFAVRKRHGALDSCLFRSGTDSAEEAYFSSDDSLVEYLADEETKFKRDCVQKNLTVMRRKLDNGNYECCHSCKEKDRCRHLCCKEGIPEGCLPGKRNSQGKGSVIPMLVVSSRGNNHDRKVRIRRPPSGDDETRSPVTIKQQDSLKRGQLTFLNQSHTPPAILEPGASTAAFTSLPECGTTIQTSLQIGSILDANSSFTRQKDEAGVEANARPCDNELEFLGSDVDFS